MMRQILALAAVLVAVAGCQSRNAVTTTQPVSYSGTLHGGMMAIGGETSGWVLSTQGDTESLDLDVSRVRDTATRLDGQRVIVRGHLIQREYVERGPVRVLVVDSISPQSGH